MKRGAALATAFWLGCSAAQAQEAIEYYHLDGLGSVRAVSDSAGALIERHDYLPFGDECTTGACATSPGVGAGQARKFTGKERDAETGLDYFAARYFSAPLGRFTGVDPLHVRVAFVDPQQWNRYAYARNNPLRYLDPSGLYVFDAATDTEKDMFEKALAAARAAGRASTGRAETDAAVDAYGEKGDSKARISFRSLDARVGALTEGDHVTFNTSLDADQLVIAVAHEGQHLADNQAYETALANAKWVNYGSRPPKLSHQESEERAYRVSAHIAQGLGWPSLVFNGKAIWVGGVGIHEANLKSVAASGPTLAPPGQK
jgi:RHS repeat-associated protein